MGIPQSERNSAPSAVAGSGDQYVRVGDVRTRFRTAGKGRPAVVLIHGIGASLEAWCRNLPELARHFRVVAPDLIWFGRSDKPRRQVTGEAFSQFMIDLMDALDIDRAVLVGNSMGGMIACKTALAHPERVAGLVLVNSAGFGKEIGWWFRLRSLGAFGQPVRISPALARWAARWIVHDPRTIADELIDMSIELAREPEAVEAYGRVLRLGVDWRGVKQEVLSEIRDAAHLITVPTLILWGRQDRLIPVKHAQVAHSRIIGSQVTILDGCGHAPMLERPDEFNRLVTDFIRERVAQAAPPV